MVKYLLPFLLVKDAERAMRHYERLGFERALVDSEVANGLYAMASGKYELIFLDGKGKTVEKAGNGVRFYIDVDNVVEMHEKAKEDAVTISELSEKPYGMIEFTAKDPDGYVFTFAQKTEDVKGGII